MNSPTGRLVLTGHSRGLGQALAHAACARGWAVLGLSRHPLGAALPGVQDVPLDLANTAGLIEFLKGPVWAEFTGGPGPLVLINNAGTVAPMAVCGAQDPHETAQAVALNVTAALLLAQAVAALPAGRDRRICHLSSGAGRSAYAGWSVYGATKAALDHHARVLALEADGALRVCSLAPGVIDTPMQAEIRATDAAHFPDVARFRALQSDGHLSAPSAVAERLWAHVLSAGFGQDTVADLRKL